eukprot:1190250-Prorocentrum_minimum.AAC.6
MDRCALGWDSDDGLVGGAMWNAYHNPGSSFVSIAWTGATSAAGATSAVSVMETSLGLTWMGAYIVLGAKISADGCSRGYSQGTARP